jgi:Ca2+/H+ antiporter, TMEM165/GDT1 family
MKRVPIRKVAGIILIAIAGIFIFGSIVMLLWNALLPVLFHFPVISFWQALGLLLLSKLLFGGFRGGGWGRGRQWKQRMQEKMNNMTPEEREKFKQEWRNRCGHRFGREFDQNKPAE